jgi:hypothetical protein
MRRRSDPSKQVSSPVLPPDDRVAAGEATRQKVELQNTVQLGRGKIKSVVDDIDLVATFQVLVCIGLQQLKIAAEDEYLVTPGQIDFTFIEGDAAQSTISSAPFPINFTLVPVNNLLNLSRIEIDYVNSSVTFPLSGGTNDRGRDYLWQLGHDCGGFTGDDLKSQLERVANCLLPLADLILGATNYRCITSTVIDILRLNRIVL